MCVIRGLEMCKNDAKLCFVQTECPYQGDFPKCCQLLMADALALLEAQGEVIEELRRVGYPHDFQNEKPWIQDYMRLITNVIKKAVKMDGR